MDYIPTIEEIKERFPEFILGEAKIEGLYANMDVDSTIFRYTLRDSVLAENMIVSITEMAGKKGWKLVEKSKILKFTRFEPSGKLFSAEETRVVILKGSEVYVAHVRTFTEKQVSQFEDAGSGAKFAKKVVWPILQSYVEGGS